MLLKEHLKQLHRSGKPCELDSLLTRVLDPTAITEVAEAIAKTYRHSGITRILTAEPAGIALAYKTAELLSVKAVFARKREEAEAYQALVNSKTHTTLYLPQKCLNASDTVLIVDDTLAMGGIAEALVEITRQANATLAGVGVALEKSYLDGKRKLSARGITVFSAVRITDETGTVE